MKIYSSERKTIENLFERSLVRLIKCKYKIKTNYMIFTPGSKTLIKFKERKTQARIKFFNKKNGIS